MVGTALMFSPSCVTVLKPLLQQQLHSLHSRWMVPLLPGVSQSMGETALVCAVSSLMALCRLRVIGVRLLHGRPMALLLHGAASLQRNSGRRNQSPSLSRVCGECGRIANRGVTWQQHIRAMGGDHCSKTRILFVF